MARFQKGQSGNPGGRPKGLAGYVQKICGKDGKKLADILWAIAQDESEKTGDRIAATAQLLDRGWNKPSQGINWQENMRPLVIDLVTDRDISHRRAAAEE